MSTAISDRPYVNKAANCTQFVGEELVQLFVPLDAWKNYYKWRRDYKSIRQYYSTRYTIFQKNQNLLETSFNAGATNSQDLTASLFVRADVNYAICNSEITQKKDAMRREVKKFNKEWNIALFHTIFESVGFFSLAYATATPLGLQVFAISKVAQIILVYQSEHLFVDHKHLAAHMIVRSFAKIGNRYFKLNDMQKVSIKCVRNITFLFIKFHQKREEAKIAKAWPAAAVEPKTGKEKLEKKDKAEQSSFSILFEKTIYTFCETSLRFKGKRILLMGMEHLEIERTFPIETVRKLFNNAVLKPATKKTSDCVRKLVKKYFPRLSTAASDSWDAAYKLKFGYDFFASDDVLKRSKEKAKSRLDEVEEKIAEIQQRSDNGQKNS